MEAVSSNVIFVSAARREASTPGSAQARTVVDGPVKGLVESRIVDDVESIREP